MDSEQAKAASLAELDAWWLQIKCCNSTSYKPLQLWARQYGERRTLGELTDRLRCKTCQGPPTVLWLVDSAVPYLQRQRVELVCREPSPVA